MMTLGFPKQKLNLNESENPLDFGFAKFVGIRQHSDLDSNSVTSLTGTGIFTGQMLRNHRHQSTEEKTLASSFLLHNQTSDGRGAAPFKLALQHQCQRLHYRIQSKTNNC